MFFDNEYELYSQSEVVAAIAEMAAPINQYLESRVSSDSPCLVICLLNGGLVFSGQLLPYLSFSLECDYIHATRYNGATVGSELTFLAHPRTPLVGRQVLLLDDIFDHGKTLASVKRYCLAQGALSVVTAVMVEKDLRDKRVRDGLASPDFVGLTVPDRYVYGFGMDVKGQLRNASGIYFLPENIVENNA